MFHDKNLEGLQFLRKVVKQIAFFSKRILKINSWEPISELYIVLFNVPFFLSLFFFFMEARPTHIANLPRIQVDKGTLFLFIIYYLKFISIDLGTIHKKIKIKTLISFQGCFEWNACSAHSEYYVSSFFMYYTLVVCLKT